MRFSRRSASLFGRGALASLPCLLAMTVTCVEPHSVGPAFAVSDAARLFPQRQDPRLAAKGRMVQPQEHVGQRQAVRSRNLILRMATDFSQGDKVIVNGKVGTLTEYKRSWWTVELDGGGVAKSRASGLAPAGVGAEGLVKTPPPPAKKAAPVRRAGTSTSTRKATGTTTRKGTGTSTRGNTPAPKTAAKAAERPAPTAPPKTGKIPDALQNVLQPPAKDESVAAYPSALADLFDAAETEGAAKPRAGAKGAKYPAGLSRVLDPKGSEAGDEAAVGYPAALAEVLDASDKTVAGQPDAAAVAYPPALARILELSSQASPTSGASASYPAALARVLNAMASGAQPPAATTTLTRKGSRTVKRGSKTVTRKGTKTVAVRKGAVGYPPALQHYLNLAAAAAAAPAPAPAKKPTRAAYPRVLANLLSLDPAASPAPTATKVAGRKGRGGSSTGTRTNKGSASKPTSASYPPVLAQLLKDAESAGAGGVMDAQVLATLAAKYPDALASYLDAAEACASPPPTVVPPPRRAVYPVVLAEALGLGLNLDDAADSDSDGDDITAQLLADADKGMADSAAPASSAAAAYPEALARILDDTPQAATAEQEREPAAYPAALADVLDLQEVSPGAQPQSVAQPTAAGYPAALERVLDLALWPGGRPAEDAPARYPAALAELYLDAVEGGTGEASAGEQEQDTAAPKEDKKPDFLSRFDDIAQNFARKFGL